MKKLIVLPAVVTILAVSTVVMASSVYIDDGASHTFDDNTFQNDHVRLDYYNIDPSGTHVNLVDGGSVDLIAAYNNSTITLSGGEVGSNLWAFNNSTVTISSGEIVGFIGARDNSTFTMSGGAVGIYIGVDDNSSFTMSGGEIDLFIRARDNATVTMSGGVIDGGFKVLDSATIYLEGSNFNVNGTSLVNGDKLSNFGDLIYNPYDNYYHGTVTGTLADGSALNNYFSIWNTGGHAGTGDIIVLFKEFVGLEISGPDEVAGGLSTQFTAAGYYDNNTTRNITNSVAWSVAPSDHCSISQGGLLVADAVDSPVDVTVYAEFTEGGVTVVGEKTVLVEAYIAPTDKMFWSECDANRIMCSNLDGSEVEVVISEGLNGPVGLILDLIGGKMYWASWGDNAIRRANFDGSNMETLISVSRPFDVAIDVESGKMYWTEHIGKKISRANLDGSNVEALIPGLGSPRSLTLDLIAGKIYWGDADPSHNSISRANVDGTGIETIISSELLYPAGLEIDVANGKIYWTDPVQNSVQRANLDGSETEDLVTTGLSTPLNLSLDTANGKMYWVDRETGKLYSANLDGTDVVIIHSDLGGPYGIALALEPVIPVAYAGLDMVLSADGECGVLVFLDGSGSSDEGGNELTYYWYYDGELFDEGVEVQAGLGLGAHVFTLIVNNVTADSLPDEVVITVVDDTPPGFTVGVDRSSLWPPNHKMVEVTPSFEITDNCSGEVAIELVDITCNQESEGDIEVTDDGIFLRAERDAHDKDGRVYTIIYKVTDGAGNETTASTEVKVPHKPR